MALRVTRLNETPFMCWFSLRTVDHIHQFLCLAGPELPTSKMLSPPEKQQKQVESPPSPSNTKHRQIWWISSKTYPQFDDKPIARPALESPSMVRDPPFCRLAARSSRFWGWRAGTAHGTPREHIDTPWFFAFNKKNNLCGIFPSAQRAAPHLLWVIFGLKNQKRTPFPVCPLCPHDPYRILKPNEQRKQWSFA